MHGSGYPQITKSSFKMGKITVNNIPQVKLSSDPKIIGTFNTKVSNNKKIKINPNIIDVTNAYIAKKTRGFKVTIKASGSKGNITINNVKLIGYKIYVEEESSDSDGIPKEDFYDKMIQSYSVNDNEIIIGDYKRGIVKDSLTINATTSSTDAGNDSKNQFSVDGDHFSFVIKYEDPSNAGNDFNNLLFVINSLKIDYTFTPNKGAPIKDTYSKTFDKQVSFIVLNDYVALSQSTEYNNFYATAFYATRHKFSFSNFKFLNKKKSPLYIKAVLILMMNYGIKSFIYNWDYIIATARVEKGAKTFLFLINFARTFNEKLTFKKVDATFSYYDRESKVITSVEASIPINSLTFSIEADKAETKNKTPLKIKGSYSVTFSLDSNKTDFKNLYFFVENKKILITAVSTNTIARSTIKYIFTRKGSTDSFINSCQIVEQLSAGLAAEYSKESLTFFLAWAPMLFFGAGVMAGGIFAEAMFFEVIAIILMLANYKVKEASEIYNVSAISDGNLDMKYIKSYIGKGTNTKANLNVLSDYIGGNIKASNLAFDNIQEISGLFTRSIVFITEAINFGVPYSFSIEDKITSVNDIFDPSKNIVLTAELESWVNIFVADIFAFNIGYFNMVGDFADGGFNKKPINKKVNIIKTINGSPINPLINFNNGKLIGDMNVKDFTKANKKKLINSLTNYLEVNKDSKNELLKYICSFMIKVLTNASPNQLRNVLIPKTLWWKFNVSNSERLINSDLCSPVIDYEITAKELSKGHTLHMLPTIPNTKIKAGEIKTNSDVYCYEDDNLRFCANPKEFIKFTAPLPDTDTPSIFY